MMSLSERHVTKAKEMIIYTHRVQDLKFSKLNFGDSFPFHR